jgi:GAF domain-containing protein
MPADNALLDVLTRFAQTLAHRYDVADVLYALTDHSVEVLDATAAGVSVGADDDTLQFVSANSEIAATLEHVQQQAREGPCHQAYSTGEEVVVNDITEHGEWPIYRDKAAELGLHSVIGIPLSVPERRLGALNIYDRTRRAWTDTDIAHARVLANIATSYVLHASHLDEARRINEQLQRALDSRIVIEQAKGILAGEYGISVEASFTTLRHHARSNDATLRSVAEAVVNLGLRPSPPPA